MEAELITIVGTILGSSLMTIAVLLRRMNHLEAKLGSRLDVLGTKFETKIDLLDTKFETRIDLLDTKFETRITGLDTKFGGKLDAMGRDISDIRERLGRVEGHLMAPGGFRLRRPQPPAAVDPPSEDPGTDQRQAG